MKYLTDHLIKRALPIVLFLISISLAACVHSTPKNELISPELPGTAWQWQELVETEPASQSLVPQPKNYTLIFQPDNTLAVQADCNQAKGSYTQKDNTLTITLGPATMAFCGEDSLDQHYLTLLGSVGNYSIENGRLVLKLKDDAGKMTFDEK